MASRAFSIKIITSNREYKISASRLRRVHRVEPMHDEETLNSHWMELKVRGFWHPQRRRK